MSGLITIPKSVPSEFHIFFWDIEASKLNPQENPHYVINRLLDKGNLEAARWVRRNFPQDLIIETIKTKKDFSPWNAVFWARFYGIERQEVRCLEPSYLTMRKQLWPY